jgi:hypothetical protein
VQEADFCAAVQRMKEHRFPLSDQQLLAARRRPPSDDGRLAAKCSDTGPLDESNRASGLRRKRPIRYPTGAVF